MEMKLRLPEHLLMRVDKLTMAHAIEARVPFLDHDVVDFATRLPPSYKLRDGVGKRILKKAAEPYLDHDLIYRRKQGFGAPMEEWFREATSARAASPPSSDSELVARGLSRPRIHHGPAARTSRGRINYGFPSLDRDERRVLARALDEPAPGGRLSRQAHACSTPPTSPRSPRPAAPAGPARSAAKSMTFRRLISPPGSGAGIASLDGAAASILPAPRPLPLVPLPVDDRDVARAGVEAGALQDRAQHRSGHALPLCSNRSWPRGGVAAGAVLRAVEALGGGVRAARGGMWWCSSTSMRPWSCRTATCRLGCSNRATGSWPASGCRRTGPSSRSRR